MLNRIFLEQSLPLASKLAAAGKRIIPIQGTPLDDIMRACSTFSLYNTAQDLDALTSNEFVGQLVDIAGAKDDNGENLHNGVVSQFVELAKSAVQQGLNNARNVVMPDVKNILQTVQEVQAGRRNTSANPYVVVPSVMPAVFSNPVLLELVERYNMTPAREVPRRELPGLTNDEIKAAITTGAAEFDAQVAELLGEEGLTQIGNVWSGGIELGFLAPEYAVGLHLLTKALYNNPPAGTNYQLSDYNNLVSLMTEQTGRITYQVIETQARRKKLGMLYNSGAAVAGANGQRIIEVNNDVYLPLLDKGLTPEMLIGNEFLGRPYSDGQLLENKENLEAAYNREKRLYDTRAELEDRNALRSTLSLVFSREIANREEADLPVDRSILQSRLNEAMKRIQDKDLNCLESLVRDLTCYIFYAHTDADMILCVMDDLGCKYPELDPREIALLATTQYVSYWVAKQMQVV